MSKKTPKRKLRPTKLRDASRPKTEPDDLSKLLWPDPDQPSQDTVAVDRLASDASKEVADPDLNERVKATIKDDLAHGKSLEGAKSDIHHELGSPPLGGGPPTFQDPSRTVQRKDGTITTADQPDRTMHYVAGKQVFITDKEFKRYLALNDEVNSLANNRLLSEIKGSDSYHDKKKELDEMVADLRG